MPVEAKSKFACLRMEDDSDSDDVPMNGKRPMNGKLVNNGGRNGDVRGNIRNGNGGGGTLIVHAVEKRTKQKRAQKEKVIDPATGLVVQDADNNFAADQQYKQQLKKAMEESLKTTKPASPSNNNSAPTISNVAKHIETLDDIITNDDTSSELFKSKISEYLERCLQAEKEAELAKMETEKYKSRYRRLVELFKDAELKDRAELVKETEHSKAEIGQLTIQLEELRTELNQARVRLRGIKK